MAKAIARFEAYSRYKDFKTFHIEQAKGFKRYLADQCSERSGELLSKATLYATLTALKRFVLWLAGQPGYKSRISYSDADYFNLSTKEVRIAKTRRRTVYHLGHHRERFHRPRTNPWYQEQLSKILRPLLGSSSQRAM